MNENDNSKKFQYFNEDEPENEILEIPPKTFKKRVSINSEIKVKDSSTVPLINPQNYSSQQFINDIRNNKNYNSTQLINDINKQVQEVLKNQLPLVNTQNSKNNETELNVIPDKLITELSSIAYELMNTKQIEYNNKNVKDLLIYTKAMEIPTKIEMLSETRVILRIIQLICAIGAFISLSVSSLQVNYNTTVIAEAGINSMCLVSISSFMVAIATLFVYFNPRILGVSPQRHFRSSRVEVCVDFLYLAFWIFATSEITIFGRCPQVLLDISKSSERNCYSWNFCMTFGYGAVIFYLISFIRGIYDLKTHDWGRTTTQKYNGKGVHLWVRGNWKEDELNQDD